MSSWNQNQNNNMVMGQAQFNPYYGVTQPVLNPNMRAPSYKAEPIHGENAAWAFPMGTNSEIYLPDADEDVIWWIRTDMNGNRQVTPFDVLPHKKAEPVDINNILARLSALEEQMNGKQNKSNAKRSTTATIESSSN